MDTHVPASDSSAEATAVAKDGTAPLPALHVEEEIAPRLYLHPPEKTESYIGRGRDGVGHPVLTRRHLRLKRDFAQFAGRLEAHGAVRRAVFARAPCLCFTAADMVVVRARLGERPDGIIVPEEAVPG